MPKYDDVSKTDNNEINVENSNQLANINQRVNVPQSGFLYTLFSNLDIANEMGGAYAQRQNVIGLTPDSRRGITVDGVLGIFDILSGVLGMTDSVLSLPNSVSQRVKHRITFKNDADIIIIPGQVNVPNGYNYNSVPRILLPGDVCVFQENHLPGHNSTERLSFSFAAISSDENVLPRATPKHMADVFPFEVFIGRNANTVFLERVHGFSGLSHTPHEIRTNSFLGSLETRYVGFRGLRGTTMPSFGIAVIQTAIATTAGSTMGTQVTFTPLSLRG